MEPFRKKNQRARTKSDNPDDKQREAQFNENYQENENFKKQQEKEGQREKDIGNEYLDEESYSNLNISFFGTNIKDISPFVKNSIGLGLLGIIFLSIYLAFRKVLYKESPKKKPKKDKKK